MSAIVDPLRRWAVEWLSARRPEVCEQILTPDYGILIGGFHLHPRENYVEGTLEQLDRFPGLGITVHELIHNGEWAAVRFTEHGPSARHDGQPAAWGGVALFRWDGERLSECFAEEDYLSRRRQLKSGECDSVEPPQAAPWAVPALAPDPAAEDAVQRWLEGSDFPDVDCDDAWIGARDPIPLAEPSTELNAIFSAGDKVGFHGRRRGRYLGGLEGVDAEGEEAVLHFAGLVTVAGGEVVGGRVVRDRLGMSRALQKVGSR